MRNVHYYFWSAILNHYDLLSFDSSYAQEEDELICRLADERDYEDVLNIEREAFEFPWSRREFEFLLNLERCGAIVALRGGRVVGYLVYELRKTSIRLLNCAVAKSERRSGVGVFLLEELADRLGTVRDEIICLVREKNVAAQLFLRHVGFRAQWIKRGYYAEAEEDAYRMSWRFKESLGIRKAA